MVSVVIPTYRRPEALREALNSLVTQTFSNFEALVCDNAADPATAMVLRDIGDPRLIYIPRPRDLGIFGNVLDGISRARGRYVMELDDDDTLVPGCLEALTEPFQAYPDIVLTFGDLWFVDADGNQMNEESLGLREPIRERLSEGIYRPFTHLAARGAVSTVTALFRRSAVEWGDTPISAETAFDRYFALAAARGDASAYYVDRKLARYRIHDQADGRINRVRQLLGALVVLEGELRRQEHADEVALRSEAAKTCLLLIRELRSRGKRGEGLHVLVRLMRQPPFADAIRVAGLLAVPESLGLRMKHMLASCHHSRILT